MFEAVRQPCWPTQVTLSAYLVPLSIALCSLSVFRPPHSGEGPGKGVALEEKLIYH